MMSLNHMQNLCLFFFNFWEKANVIYKLVSLYLHIYHHNFLLGKKMLRFCSKSSDFSCFFFCHEEQRNAADINVCAKAHRGNSDRWRGGRVVPYTLWLPPCCDSWNPRDQLSWRLLKFAHALCCRHPRPSQDREAHSLQSVVRRQRH